jgi:oligopeptide/dipeptide ABC transporter ATP-binding protein
VSDRKPLVTLRNVRKYFPIRGILPGSKSSGNLRAIDGISFDVRSGETFVLVGESGCGKTTTGRLVLRLDEPTSGRIAYQGADLWKLKGPDLRRYRMAVQAVFQDPWGSLNPRMRVGDSIAEPLVVSRRMPRQEAKARVAQLLRSVGLGPEAASNFPHEFSGGQRQRIALARALALNPELIVLDEPVSALDVSIRAQIMNLLKDLQGQLGVAYLLISHNLATVRYLGHQVAVMHLGEIVEMASTDDLFTNALHPYTLALLSADLPVRRERVKRIILKGDLPSPAHPPAGCRFHTRCWLFEQLGRPEICTVEQPKLLASGDGHEVACHFANRSGELLRSAQHAQ